MKPFICLITGPAGVGKTTVANLLAKAFPKTARINVDELRHAVINGKVHPFPTTQASMKQLALATQNATSLAKNYNDAGFTVFIDDVVLEEEALTAYIEQTIGYRLIVFLLICDREQLITRDQQRIAEFQMGKRSIELLDQFNQRKNENRWIKLDTSTQIGDETVEMILKGINQHPLQ